MAKENGCRGASGGAVSSDLTRLAGFGPVPELKNRRDYSALSRRFGFLVRLKPYQNDAEPLRAVAIIRDGIASIPDGIVRKWVDIARSRPDLAP